MARPKRKRTIGPAEAARAKKAKTAAAAKVAKAKAAAQKAAAAEAAAASVGSSESEEEDLGQGEEVAMPSKYDDMDLPALIRAVFSLPADAQPVEIVDAAVSAADVDGLRKILRDVDAAVEPTEFDGMRPLLDLQKLPKVNILFPRWFHVRDADLDSALMAPPTGTGLETSGAGGELQDFTTVEEWFHAAVYLQQYACATTPPVLGVGDAAQHMVYIMALREEMQSHGANEDSAVLNIFVKFDEKVRLHKVQVSAGIGGEMRPRSVTSSARRGVVRPSAGARVLDARASLGWD